MIRKKIKKKRNIYTHKHTHKKKMIKYILYKINFNNIFLVIVYRISFLWLPTKTGYGHLISMKIVSRNSRIMPKVGVTI